MIKCLDNGFVELENVSHKDCELAIVNSARVSYNRDQQESTTGQNNGLIEFLLANRHTSPFECVSFSFHIKTPLSIATQILRHRTAKVNCLSHRYSEAKTGRFDPVLEVDDIRYQSTLNKQKSDRNGEDQRDKEILELYKKQIELADKMEENYRTLVALGAAKEQARFYLTEGTYTRMHWTMDVHNLLHFLELRMAPDAQYEIQVYATAILTLIEPHIPNIIAAFRKYRLHSLHFDENEIVLLKELISETQIDPEKLSSLGSIRRQQGFTDKLSLLKK